MKNKTEIEVSPDFKAWIKKKKKWNELAFEDTLRRLTGFKPRKLD